MISAPAHLVLCDVPQERQRLETILNLCAEYNKPDVGGLGELGPSMDALRVGSPRTIRRQRGSMEENHREDCSSVEMTQQEVRSSTDIVIVIV